MLPVKIGSVGKDLGHIPQRYEFESHYRCKNFVSKQFVSISVSTHAVRHVLTLLNYWSPTHQNNNKKKMFLTR